MSLETTSIIETVQWNEAPLWWLHKELTASLDEIDAAIKHASELPVGDILEENVHQITILMEWYDYIMNIIQAKQNGETYCVQ